MQHLQDSEQVGIKVKEIEMSNQYQNCKNDSTVMSMLVKLLSGFKNDDRKRLLQQELETEKRKPVKCAKTYCTLLSNIRDSSQYIAEDRMLFASIRNMEAEDQYIMSQGQ